MMDSQLVTGERTRLPSPIPNGAVLLGAIIHCPHCGKLLRCIEVKERCEDIEPESKQRMGFYPIKLEDGTWARMWERDP